MASALNTKKTCSSEKSADFEQTTSSYIPEDITP
jgi:hypothetical protein